MNISDYIVPIFSEGVFNGTGFIIGSTLITAAHVIESKENVCYFLYGKEEISIGSDNNIVFEYPVKESMQGKDNRYWDLAIYKLSNINSPIKLQSPNLSKPCTYHGYSDVKQIDIYTNIMLDNNAYYYPCEYNRKPVRIYNCYFSTVGKSKVGNSGGPLFQGDSVIGMLSGDQILCHLSWDRIIKAEYINSCLSKHCNIGNTK